MLKSIVAPVQGLDAKPPAASASTSSGAKCRQKTTIIFGLLKLQRKPLCKESPRAAEVAEHVAVNGLVASVELTQH